MIERFHGRELDANDKAFLAKVEEHGWMVMSIKDEPGKPGWSYTVGLFENFAHPEIVIFGLKPDSRHRILNWIGDNVKRNNPFTAEKEHEWVLDNYKCWSKPVQKRWYYDLLGYARWFYKTGRDSDNFPCVQALWPDKAGIFPWQSEYGYADQPLLYETELVAARMMHYASAKNLRKEEWPFEEDPHTTTYVSRNVIENGALILHVYHERDGDWQFIGPAEADPSLEKCQIACFHCMVERDPSLKLLAGLPVGMRAVRNNSSDQWKWEDFEEQIED